MHFVEVYGGFTVHLFIFFNLRLAERLCMVLVVCVFLLVSVMDLFLPVGGAATSSSTVVFFVSSGR
jgi:hypothetical protein